MTSEISNIAEEEFEPDLESTRIGQTGLFLHATEASFSEELDSIIEDDGDLTYQAGTSSKVQTARKEFKKRKTDAPRDPPKTTGGRKCKCKPSVPDQLKKDLENCKGAEQKTKQIPLLEMFMDAMGPNTAWELGNYNVCYMHTQRMASVLQLMTKGRDHAALLTVLLACYIRKDRLVQMKTARDTYSLFRGAGRPAVPCDVLGPYRFWGKDPVNRFVYEYPREVVIPFVQVACNFTEAKAKSAMSEWDVNGTINLPVFKGLVEEPELKKIINLEYRMYEWHSRKINGRPNYGWLRTIVFSVTQQMIRMDLGYYLLYAALRKDNLAWLISYPYYVKAQKKGDATGFLQVDHNLKRLSEGIGARQIPGSVTLGPNDEVAPDSTILVPKMHKKEIMGKWMQRLADRNLLNEGFVSKISKKHLTAQDLKDFKTNWEFVPCKNGDVRITQPHLPHGAVGPAKWERRTVLPWFCGNDRNHEDLEVKLGGKWQQIAESNRDFTRPPATPGKSNVYGSIPFRFPAAYKVEPPNLIAKALIGEAKWDSNEVQYSLEGIAKYGRKGNVKELRSLVMEFRGKMRQNARDAFARVRQLEKDTFGDASFFRNYEMKERGEKPHHWPNPPEPNFHPHDTKAFGYNAHATMLVASEGYDEDDSEARDDDERYEDLEAPMSMEDVSETFASGTEHESGLYSPASVR